MSTTNTDLTTEQKLINHINGVKKNLYTLYNNFLNIDKYKQLNNYFLI